jgi:tRNA(fMet)-specific endonuclease VapC
MRSSSELTTPPGSRLALDTNKAIDILNGEAGIEQRLQPDAHVCLPVVVLGELIYGALNSTRSNENLERVERLRLHCEVLPISAATADQYARARLQLKKTGRPIPENDLWIAASCLEHSMPLATADDHFRSVDGLVIADV